MRVAVDPNSFINVHAWIRKNFIKKGICEHCGLSAKTELSNKSGGYNKDLSDWQELCTPCHRKYDRQEHMRGASRRAGAPIIKSNVWFLRNVDETTKRKLRVFAVKHDLELGPALAKIIEIVETGKEAIIDELKDLGKTFPNTPNKSYTGQQIHQVIDSRIKYQKERNE